MIRASSACSFATARASSREGWGVRRSSDSRASAETRRLAACSAAPAKPAGAEQVQNKLLQLQANPQLAAGILDRLKADESLYVRKSVSNHLNDVTKEHPEWFPSWPPQSIQKISS